MLQRNGEQEEEHVKERRNENGGSDGTSMEDWEKEIQQWLKEKDIVIWCIGMGYGEDGKERLGLKRKRGEVAG